MTDGRVGGGKVDILFVGHFAFAFVLMWLFPGANPLVILVGVSFPDLLWPFLVFSGVEKVTVDPASPLQGHIRFLQLRYSHSLVLGTAIASIVGVVLGLALGPINGLVFVLASASHWILDIPVHLRDLPVLGFNRDRKVGLGLWTRPRLAFGLELLFYVAVSALFVPPTLVPIVILLGVVFHSLNANSFFGFTKKNPTPTAAGYAALALAGFGLYILAYAALISGL